MAGLEKQIGQAIADMGSLGLPSRFKNGASGSLTSSDGAEKSDGGAGVDDYEGERGFVGQGFGTLDQRSHAQNSVSKDRWALLRMQDRSVRLSAPACPAGTGVDRWAENNRTGFWPGKSVVAESRVVHR